LTRNQSAADQQKLAFSPVYTAAEMKPLLLSSLTYSRAKLLGNADRLARKISDGLVEVRSLRGGEIESRQGIIQGLWRASAQWNNYSVKRLTGEMEQLVPQRDVLLIQTQLWVAEKQDLNRNIAELMEGIAPSS
jgi:hypothetical protein